MTTLTEFIPIDAIKINDRIRSEFPSDKLNELANSIQSIGLIHAPVLSLDNSLVAGGCRIAAMVKLHAECIPFTYMGIDVPLNQIPCVTSIATLSEDDLLEIEIEENVRRTDLSWQDRTRALDKLHKLRTSQNPQQTINATTAEAFNIPEGELIDRSKAQSVSKAAILTEHLTDPTIAAAKTEKEALKLLSKKMEKEFQEYLVENEGLSKKSGHQLHHGDSLVWMAEYQGRPFNCIITDPPYGIDADQFNNQSADAHTYRDNIDYAEECYSVLASEGYRITAPDAHLYAFCDMKLFPFFAGILEENGWNVWPQPLIWYKGNKGLLPVPDYGPRRTYEAIIFATKGKKPLARVGAHDVIVNAPLLDSTRAAAKPPALYEELLSRSCHAGERVLDPFAGTGPIFPASTSLDLTAVGIEREKHAVNLATLTINKLGENS